MKLLAELKRRNVIRMAGLYLVGAWLVIQVAATLLPTFDAPTWVMKVLVALLAIGFLAAIVFSWLYELTPGGLKRDGEVTPDQSVAAATGKRMDRLLLIGMLAVIGVIAADRFWPRELSHASSAAARLTSPLPAPLVPIADPPANAAADPADKTIVRGIAVLPFDNLSPDPDNAFFAGGVYEEVLTKLSRIGELRVISRTSMEQIAKQDLQVGTIGQRLGVSHVLEGSVRKAGDQIRVTVQLIEAASDNHIWAENYDRKLDDVFAIQSEIALAIADQLKLSLSPELQANLSERPTQNQAAYALYLRALEERGTWRGSDGFKAMIDLLEPAVATDPDFLQAQVLLADAYGRMNWTNSDPDGSYADKARQAVAQILERWPDHPQSRIAQGQLRYNLDRDYAGALTHFEAVRAQLPNDIELLRSIASSLKWLGRNEAFLEVARRVVELDPESALSFSELLLALWANQRLDEAVTTAERSYARFPQDQLTRRNLAWAKVERDGDIEAVLQLTPDSREAMMAHFVKGDFDALQRPRDPLGPNHHSLTRAELLKVAGKQAAAQAVLEPFTQQVVPGILAQLSDTSLTDRDRAMAHGRVAGWAALVGKPEQAREHLTQALAVPPSSDLAPFYIVLSIAERRLGNADAAWLLVEPYIGQTGIYGHGELRAFKPFYDKVYGESPSYRAYMAKIAAEKR
jgi:TolB-like protein